MQNIGHGMLANWFNQSVHMIGHDDESIEQVSVAIEMRKFR